MSSRESFAILLSLAVVALVGLVPCSKSDGPASPIFFQHVSCLAFVLRASGRNKKFAERQLRKARFYRCCIDHCILVQVEEHCSSIAKSKCDYCFSLLAVCFSLLSIVPVRRVSFASTKRPSDHRHKREPPLRLQSHLFTIHHLLFVRPIIRITIRWQRRQRDES